MTHDEGVKLCEKYLVKEGYSQVLTEPVGSGTGEIPDAIGWRRRSATIDSCVLEWKCSVGDLKVDAAKPHRRAGYGMGVTRYICSDRMEILQHCPDKWGAIFFSDGEGVVVREAMERNPNETAERGVLLHALKNMTKATGVQASGAVARKSGRLSAPQMEFIEFHVAENPGVMAKELAHDPRIAEKPSVFARMLERTLSSGDFRVRTEGVPMVLYPTD